MIIHGIQWQISVMPNIVADQQGGDTGRQRANNIPVNAAKVNGIVQFSTDFFKSLLVSRIRTPLDQPGSFIVPDDIDEDYARQLVSEVRVVDSATGKPQWVQRSRQNHYLDCEALAMAIGYSLNVQRIPEGILREQSETALTDAQDSETKSKSETVAALAVAAAPDLRARFAGLSSRLNR
jgi:phage terminase large subunit GpA-like protein